MLTEDEIEGGVHSRGPAGCRESAGHFRQDHGDEAMVRAAAKVAQPSLHRERRRTFTVSLRSATATGTACSEGDPWRRPRAALEERVGKTPRHVENDLYRRVEPDTGGPYYRCGTATSSSSITWTMPPRPGRMFSAGGDLRRGERHPG